MKQKLSITIDESLLDKLETLVKTGKFRNKSHIVEYSINQLLEKK